MDSLITGTAGIVGIEVAANAAQLAPAADGGWLSAIIQLIVACATIFKLFKKTK